MTILGEQPGGLPTIHWTVHQTSMFNLLVTSLKKTTLATEMAKLAVELDKLDIQRSGDLSIAWMDLRNIGAVKLSAIKLV